MCNRSGAWSIGFRDCDLVQAFACDEHIPLVLNRLSGIIKELNPELPDMVFHVQHDDVGRVLVGEVFKCDGLKEEADLRKTIEEALEEAARREEPCP